MDSSPLSSSVHGIFQVKILEGLPFPTPRDLPDPEIGSVSPASSAWAGSFFTTEPPGNPPYFLLTSNKAKKALEV